MKASDWECPVCGRPMLKTSADYLACFTPHSKLIPAPLLRDLPRAHRVGGGQKHAIEGEEGLWEYVPHGHKDALNRSPAEGVVVAAVHLGGWDRIYARSFRRVARRVRPSPCRRTRGA